MDKENSTKAMEITLKEVSLMVSSMELGI